MTKQTSKPVASKAARMLSDRSVSEKKKSVAGSVLAQTGSSGATSPNVAAEAAKKLSKATTSAKAKSVSGSALSQTRR